MNHCFVEMLLLSVSSLSPSRWDLHRRLKAVDDDRKAVVVVVVVLAGIATVSMAEQTAHVRHPWRVHCSPMPPMHHRLLH